MSSTTPTPNFSEIVGEREYWCTGGFNSWGVRTDHHQAEDWDYEESWDYNCVICSGGNCVPCF
ncbi:MAG TPA: hypothetical protein VEK79_08095 [Thermoanaerobaculia bacterium]|nr:hypothetical protein [Thermoanaerobaculia bacterium]